MKSDLYGGTLMIAAYIDPSSMTYLIQIIAGVVIAAGAGIGFYWKRIRRSLRKKEANGSDAPVGDEAADVDGGEIITAEMLRDSAQPDAAEQKQE